MKKNSAFTFIEIVITMLLIVVIGAIGFSAGIRYLNAVSLQSAAKELTQNVKMTQMFSLAGDKDHGIRFKENSYVIFNSSAEIDAINLPEQVTLSGFSLPDEVIFSHLTGKASKTMEIILKDTKTNEIKTIKIQ